MIPIDRLTQSNAPLELLVQCFFISSLLLMLAFLMDALARFAKQLLWQSTIWHSTYLGLLALPWLIMFPIQLPFGAVQIDLRTRIQNVMVAPAIVLPQVEPQGPKSWVDGDAFPHGDDSSILEQTPNQIPTAASHVSLRADEDLTFSFPHMILTIYVLVVIYGVWRLLVDFVSTTVLMKSASLNRESGWIQIQRKCCEEMGIAKGPPLFESSEINTPMIVGVFRPSIVLPKAISRTSDDHMLMSCVLYHELTHIKRHDLQWQFLSRILTIVYWFQPLLWLSRRTLSAVRERICDQYSATAIGDRDAYSHTLIEAANRAISSRPQNLALSMVATSDLEKRIDLLLASHEMKRCVAPKRVRFFTLAITLSLLAFSSGDGQTPEGKSQERATDREDPPFRKHASTLGKDRFGDPLPASAIARMGTVRFRSAEGVRSTAISPDGKYAATITFLGQPTIWDVPTGKLVHKFEVEVNGISIAGPILFSPDGKRIVSGDRLGTIRIWSIPQKRIVHEIELQSELEIRPTSHTVTDLTFSHDGKTIVSAHRTGEVCLIDAKTGHRKAIVTTAEGANRHSVALSIDGKFLASGVDLIGRGQIRIWRLDDLEEPILIELPQRTSPVSLAFDPNTNQLFAGCATSRRRGEVSIWDPHSGKKIGTLANGENKTTGPWVVFSFDGSTMMTANLHQAWIWDARSRTIKRQIRSIGRWNRRQSNLSISADGSLAMLNEEHVYVVHCKTGKLVHPEFMTHPSTVLLANFDRSGTQIVTYCSDKSLAFWNIATGRLVKRLEMMRPNDRLSLISSDGSHFGRIFELDNERKTTVQIWNLKYGELEREFIIDGRVTAAAISPTGELIAASSFASMDSSRQAIKSQKKYVVTQLLDVESGNLISKWESLNFPLSTLVFNREGNSLSWVNKNNASGRWDFNGEVESKSETIAEPFQIVRAWYNVYSSDRKTSIESMDDGSIKVKDVETGMERYTIRTSNCSINSLAISHDDRILASAGHSLRGNDDYAIYLWDLETGKQIAKVGIPDSAVTCMSFSVDDRRLVCGTTIGNLLVWSLDKHLESSERSL